ncbi:MAG TPA: acetyl-CoA synthetase, partial [Clostridiales bacterium]|nr:acetyl-CoA synthetase [Clostridiales bacterium]
NYSVNVPHNFNFAYDIIDEWGKNFPNKEALYWTDDGGIDKILTFTDLTKLSNQAANIFLSLGIKKGDTV